YQRFSALYSAESNPNSVCNKYFAHATNRAVFTSFIVVFSILSTELEIHRLFKSEMYNNIEHKLKTTYTRKSKFTQRERFVLFGHCKHSRLTSRLRYFEHALVLPENKFEELKMSLGILGLPRSGFDTMLKEIKMLPSTASSSAGSFRHSVGRSSSRASRVSSSLKKSGMLVKLFENIYIPEKYGE
ncbi:Uncharacterized protein OBRU01_19061, partial [Operophtera brumata]